MNKIREEIAKQMDRQVDTADLRYGLNGVYIDIVVQLDGTIPEEPWRLPADEKTFVLSSRLADWASVDKALKYLQVRNLEEYHVAIEDLVTQYIESNMDLIKPRIEKEIEAQLEHHNLIDVELDGVYLCVHLDGDANIKLDDLKPTDTMLVVKIISDEELDDFDDVFEIESTGRFEDAVEAAVEKYAKLLMEE